MSARFLVELTCDEGTLGASDCAVRVQTTAELTQFEDYLARADVDLPEGWDCSPSANVDSRFFCPEHRLDRHRSKT